MFIGIKHILNYIKLKLLNSIMNLSLIRAICIVVLVWLLLIIAGLFLFSIFIVVGCCIKDCIIPTTKKICPCIICIFKKENDEEINKKTELV